MDWNCTLTEERLSDVLDGALVPEEQGAFSAHSVGCERCTRLVAEVNELVTRMHQIPLLDEPPFLASRIVAVTRGIPAQERRTSGWLAWIPAIRPARFAMGAITLATSFMIVFHAVGSISHRTAFNPASIYHNANRHVHLTYARGVKFVNDLRVVYVIQSRLSSEPQPVSEPSSAPLPQHESAPQQRPPDSETRPNSRPAPRMDRNNLRSVTSLAILMVSSGTQALLHETSRSVP